MLTTHVALFSDHLEEMKPLNKIHYKEISEHKKHGFELEPNYPKYLEKEKNGELLYIALRKNGELVGYYIGFLGTALHYKTCFQLSLDIIYVKPMARGDQGGENGGDLLLNAVDIVAKQRNIRLSTIGYKVKHSIFMRKLLERHGYNDFEIHCAKWYD